MLSRKENTNTSDFEKELIFHLSELRYHQENYLASIREAQYHLKKSLEHDSLINELNHNFNSEVSHV
jgi:hypothetical protein